MAKIPQMIYLKMSRAKMQNICFLYFSVRQKDDWICSDSCDLLIYRCRTICHLLHIVVAHFTFDIPRNIRLYRIFVFIYYTNRIYSIFKNVVVEMYVHSIHSGKLCSQTRTDVCVPRHCPNHKVSYLCNKINNKHQNQYKKSTNV